MTADRIFQILCEIYAKQEGLAVERIMDKEPRQSGNYQMEGMKK